MDVGFLSEGKYKVLKFCLIGAIGCLFGAIIGEIPFRLLLPAQGKPQVDVLFVLDVTSSMGEEITGIREGIIDFSNALSSQGLDARIGLLAFGDHRIGEASRLLQFDGNPFTSDHESFQRQVGALRPSGGGDGPESSLDGLLEASRQPFRQDAEKVLLLITDAPPHNEIAQQAPDVASLGQVRQALQEQQIDWLHLVVQTVDAASYTGLQDEAPGNLFPLSGARQSFDEALAQIGQQIGEEIAGLNTGGTFSAKSLPRLTFATGVWTAFLAVAVSLALIAAQNLYLRRAPLNSRETTVGVCGGLLAGLAGGVVGQLLYSGLGWFGGMLFALLGALLAATGFLVGWALLGALVGRGMAYFVPNLPPRRVLLFGGLGGALAAIGFLVITAGLGDLAGRLMGAAILGLFIGLAIALVEAASRNAWLEIRYGEKETVNVNLGSQSVRIGGDARRCAVWALGTDPVVCEYTFQDGKVLCTDVKGERTQELPLGATRVVGNLTIAVCGGEGVASPAEAPPPPPPPTAARGKSGDRQTAPEGTAGQPQAPGSEEPSSAHRQSQPSARASSSPSSATQKDLKHERTLFNLKASTSWIASSDTSTTFASVP